MCMNEWAWAGSLLSSFGDMDMYEIVRDTWLHTLLQALDDPFRYKEIEGIPTISTKYVSILDIISDRKGDNFYGFHRSIVTECLGKVYVPFPSHTLSWTPTSSFPFMFVTETLEPLTVYTLISPSGAPSTVVSKSFDSWTLTTPTLTQPSSFSVALTSSQGVSFAPRSHLGEVSPSNVPQLTWAPIVQPLMKREKSQRGHQIVCLVIPSLEVINGEITLTLCAMQAIPTSLLFRTNTFNHTPTASASESVYFSSAPSLPSARIGSQTFHSSKQIVGRGWSFGTSFSTLARSIREDVISIALSAARGAVAFAWWSSDVVYMWMLCISIRVLLLVDSPENAGSKQCFRV